jgi:hypothetical protein
MRSAVKKTWVFPQVVERYIVVSVEVVAMSTTRRMTPPMIAIFAMAGSEFSRSRNDPIWPLYASVAG